VTFLLIVAGAVCVLSFAGALMIDLTIRRDRRREAEMRSAMLGEPRPDGLFPFEIRDGRDG
jgi:hypothetical protein